jgi:hypothetical protein
MLRPLFESVVQCCIAQSLISTGFAVDASLIAADANKQLSVPSREWKPERNSRRAGVLPLLTTRRRGCLARDAEIHFASRSGGPMDRRTQGTRLPRLCQ